MTLAEYVAEFILRHSPEARRLVQTLTYLVNQAIQSLQTPTPRQLRLC